MRQQNKWLHGPTQFQNLSLDSHMGVHDGFLPLPVILDPSIGEEVALFVRDQTPFMEKLRQINPFRLMLKSGCARNNFGAIIFLLFWVQNPLDYSEPFAAWDCYIDPKDAVMMRLWRALASQSHWHLFLIGTEDKQENFFEFENDYGLNEALDFMESACSNIETIDFNRAKEQFMCENSIDEIFQME